MYLKDRNKGKMEVHIFKYVRVERVNELDKQKIQEALVSQPNAFPSSIAQQLGVSEYAVVRELSADAVQEVPASSFDEIMKEVTQWGDLTFLVRNGSVIAEIKATVPPGSYGHGYFNFEHGASPIGGHICADQLGAIYFVTKPSFGMESLSIQFFDKQGENMFKIYLARTEDKQIIPQQKEAFNKLKASLATK